MSTFAAMLATELDKDSARLGGIVNSSPIPAVEKFLTHNHYWASQKIDGRRMQAVRTDDTIILLNRKGTAFTLEIDPAVRADLMRLNPGWWLDGEYLNGVYHVFDCVTAPNGTILPDMPFHQRWATLVTIWPDWAPVACHRLCYAVTQEEKRTLLAEVQKENGEGIIFRYDESTYQFGQRSPLLVKYKFWKAADVIAFNVGREGKSSTGIAVFDGEELRDIGAVTLSGALYGTLKAGDVMEVKYLYLTADGQLYQTSVLRVRDDKSPSECTFNQFTPTNKTVLA